MKNLDFQPKALVADEKSGFDELSGSDIKLKLGLVEFFLQALILFFLL